MERKKQLVGSWRLVSIERRGCSQPFRVGMKIHVLPEGRYTIVLEQRHGEARYTGSYEVVGDQIRRIPDPGLEVPEFSFEVSGEKLILDFPSGEKFTFRSLPEV